MGSLDLMKKRLERRGGIKREDRIVKGKEHALRKSLFNTYQGHTIELEDGKQFRAIINPDEQNFDNDNKILSVPHKDICLNAEKVGKKEEGYVDIEIANGDIVKWVETETNWIVHLQRLEETAYFKAEIKRCDYECAGKPVYFRGPTAVNAVWNKSENFMYNQMNYDARMIASAKNFDFKRLEVIEVADKNWEIQVVDRLSTPGILDIYLKEYFTDSISEEQKEERQAEIQEKKYTLIQKQNTSRIVGKKEVYPYDIETYTIDGGNGQWSVNNKKAVILEQSPTSVKVEIKTGKMGEFELSYTENNETTILPVVIKSL